MHLPSLRHSWQGRFLGEGDRYRIEKPLSMGNMGDDAFLATDTKLLVQVVIKVLKESLVTSTEMRERFKQEVVSYTALDNEHIVKIIDSGFSSEGYPFYVMECLKDQSLQQLLEQENCLSVKRAVAIATPEGLTTTKPPLVTLNEEDMSSTIVQSSNVLPVKSAQESNNTIVQSAPSRELGLGLSDASTRVQVSSSGTAIHPPVTDFTGTDGTIVQLRSNSRLNLDTTVYQQVARPMPKLSQQSVEVSEQENQDIDRGRGLFPLLFEAPSRILSSVWVTVRNWIRFPSFINQPEPVPHLKGNFSSRQTEANSGLLRSRQSQGSAPASEDATLDAKSYEDAIKKLNECRLSYAKELARNGKFRDAIATAKSIPETSLLHPQAQMLIERWKKM